MHTRDNIWVSPYRGDNEALCSPYLDLVEVDGPRCMHLLDRDRASARAGEQERLPMANRAGDNPDCIALALCSGEYPLGLLYAQNKREGSRSTVTVQALRIHAELNSHGLAELLLFAALPVLAERFRPQVLEFVFDEREFGHGALARDAAVDRETLGAWRRIQSEIADQVFERWLDRPLRRRRLSGEEIGVVAGGSVALPKVLNPNLLGLPPGDTPRSFRDRHRGRRGFILASGPSLNDIDLSQLEGEVVLAVNRSIDAYPSATYGCCMAEHAFANFGATLRRARVLFSTQDRPFGIPMPTLGIQGFSRDVEKGVFTGRTVSLVALQLAVYMGLGPIHFLGLDLRNSGRQTHFFGRDPINDQHDDTEFPAMRAAFEEALPALAAEGIRVTHSSPVCELQAMPYVPWQELFTAGVR